AGTLGHADGPGRAARFYSPSGVVLDSAGNLYVSDTGNCTIRKITPAGEVSTLAGLALSRGSADGPGNDARFNWPTGLARDNAGNLYVADLNNFTIRFGQLASVTPPSLRFNLVANHLILSWPQSASNCVLQTSSTLSPGATWTPVSIPGGHLRRQHRPDQHCGYRQPLLPPAHPLTAAGPFAPLQPAHPQSAPCSWCRCGKTPFLYPCDLCDPWLGVLFHPSGPPDSPPPGPLPNTAPIQSWLAS
ncbi:MAG TPA: hypothetical protein VNZ22_12465, partial [Bacillota bacterium]|nr:hypothetical protein [Bacillota bacterium]